MPTDGVEYDVIICARIFTDMETCSFSERTFLEFAEDAERMKTGLSRALKTS